MTNWLNYLDSKDINILSSSDVYNIAFFYSCFNNDNYWNLLNNFVSEKLIFVLIRNLHYFWTDLDNLEEKIEKFKELLKNLSSSKKIFITWQKNSNIIVGNKKKNLLKYLLEEIQYDITNLSKLYSDKRYDIKKTDLISCLIYYEYIKFLFEQDNDIENIAKIYKYSVDFLKYSQRPNFRNYEIERPNSKSIITYQEDVIAKLIIKINGCTYFNKNIDYELNFKAKTIDYLIKTYGDPREKTNKWANYNNKKVLSILKGWLNEKDIRFFFENLVDDDETSQDRKGFWINYCVDKVDEAKFIFSKDTNAYKNNRETILKYYNKLKNNKMFWLPKLKTNIFIIKMRNLVIVEFSEAGNACYIYDAQVYKNEKIESVLLSSISREQATIKNFKNKNIALEIVMHNSSQNDDKDWQESMKKILAKYLIS